MFDRGSKRKRLFLLDGTALAYRSYFAFIRNPLINSKGMNTSGIYGFTSTLIRILKNEKPDYIGCVFDTAAPTFRHQTYPEYKATREKMPDDLVDQLPFIRDVVNSFGIPVIEMEGYEADDVMGTLAKQAEADDIVTFLVTGDKDFMQLVGDYVKIYHLKTKGRTSETEILDSDGVKQKMGVPPNKIIDLLGLMGDKSDNIPGVPNIGPKTALNLIQEYDSLEKAVANYEHVKQQRIRENLSKYRDQAILSKQLVTICTEVPVEISISDLKFKSPNPDLILNQFRELEFNSLIQEIPDLLKESQKEEIKDYRAITTIEDFEFLINELKKLSMFVLDLETTSLNPIVAKIVGLSFSWKQNQAVYLPFRVSGQQFSGDLHDKYSPDSLLMKMKPILEDEKIRKCGQNIKYDLLVLKRHGVCLKGVDFDTMIAAYLVNPSANHFGMDSLALEYLNYQKIPTKDLIGTGQKQITMDLVDLEHITEYACEDADITYRLRQILEPKLKETETEGLFHDVEIPLIQVLAEMEENGVAIDRQLLSQMGQNMKEEIDRLQDVIYGIAGEPFNINSTQQLGRILFEKLKVHEILGLRRPRKTKTGQYATDSRVLESLIKHPLPKNMLDYRQLMKLKSTYVDALIELVNPLTQRVHAFFNQTVAATGRLSSSNPNLQNIPIRTDLGREIRKAFIPGNPEWFLLSADYSQIELRIMAHLSGDEMLLESFRNNEDVHRRTAAEIFGIKPEEVNSDLRRKAKAINFGIIYGMGVFGLAKRLEISYEEAQNFINGYFVRYPKVNAFIIKTIGQAYQQGYITTLLNRRRYLPELKSEKQNIREFGERMAINTPIQGTAADLIKVAMIRIQDGLKKNKWKSRMILQIHDELVFEVPDDEIDRLSKMVKTEMEDALELSVPIQVDIGVGKNWYEAH